VVTPVNAEHKFRTWYL